MGGWTYDNDPKMYNMTVTVTDQYGLVDGPKPLVFTVVNQRYPPEINNLPKLLTFTEGYGSNLIDVLLYTVIVFIVIISVVLGVVDINTALEL